MFELRQLRLIRALSREGTVTRAAESLSFTPSAVSQQLAAMSRAAGQPLTRREGRRVLLTRAGERLALHAEEILAAVALAEAEVAAVGQAASPLRVATFPTGGRSLLIPALADVALRHPQLRVEVVEGEPDATVPLLMNGVVDLALTYSYSLLPRQTPSGLAVTALVDEPLLLVCDDSVAKRLRAAGASSRAVLQDLDWVAGPVGSDDRVVTHRVCAVLGFEPRIVHAADDYSLTLALVGAGLGVSLVPLAAVEGVPQGVRALPVPGTTPMRHVAATVQLGHQRRTLTADLLNALTTAAQERRAV